MEKIKVYKTTGGCMRPLIKSSEFIFVLPQKKIRCGDVILYKFFGDIYLHRVKKIIGDKIILVDDAGVISPVQISINDVVGVYPVVLSGTIGYIYNLIIRNLFSFCRRLKNFLCFVKR